MTKSKGNWPRKKPKIRETQDFSVNNLGCQPVQRKRKNKTPKRSFKRNIPLKEDFQVKNTQVNRQPVKKSMFQNPKPKQFAIIMENKAT